jgi:xanthine dehydrogenase accessory factor
MAKRHSGRAESMGGNQRAPVLVRGVGDVGSAVAAVLFRAGYGVALHDEPAPTAPRRGMAFVDAVFDGSASIDGLIARRVETADGLRDSLTGGAALPVAVWPIAKFWAQPSGRQ